MRGEAASPREGVAHMGELVAACDGWARTEPDRSSTRGLVPRLNTAGPATSSCTYAPRSEGATGNRSRRRSASAKPSSGASGAAKPRVHEGFAYVGQWGFEDWAPHPRGVDQPSRAAIRFRRPIVWDQVEDVVLALRRRMDDEAVPSHSRDRARAGRPRASGLGRPCRASGRNLQHGNDDGASEHPDDRSRKRSSAHERALRVRQRAADARARRDAPRPLA